jgi:hypothetical protein
LLTPPRGLAYWIQDDGYRQGAGLHLNVYAFSPLPPQPPEGVGGGGGEDVDRCK